MNAIQKQCWLNVTVIGAAFALFLVSIPFFGFIRSGPMLGLVGLIGFGLIFYWRRDKSKVLADERDRLIQLRARSFAFGTFSTLFLLTCFALWMIYGEDGAIPVRLVHGLMYLGWGTWELAMSIAVLVQYRQSA